MRNFAKIATVSLLSLLCLAQCQPGDKSEDTTRSGIAKGPTADRPKGDIDPSKGDRAQMNARLAQEARAQHLDQTPAFVSQMETLLAQALLRKEVDDKAHKSVSDSQVDAALTSEPAAPSRRMRISHILFETEKQADAFYKSWLKTKHKDGSVQADFAKDVAKLSKHEESRRRAGDLGHVDKEGSDWRAALANAAWDSTEVGAITAPIQTDLGWHVVQITGIAALRVPDEKQRRASVRSRLEAEARTGLKRELLERLMKKQRE